MFAYRLLYRDQADSLHPITKPVYQPSHRALRRLLPLLILCLLSACRPSVSAPRAGALLAGGRAPHSGGVVLSAAGRTTTTSSGAYWQLDPTQLPTDHASHKLGKGGDALAARPPANEFEGRGDGPLKRHNFFAAQRAYPLDHLPSGGYARAVKQMAGMLPLQAAAALPQWQNIGPAPMRNSKMGQQPIDVSGRVLSIAIDPRNSDLVYIGTALGGVWKTTNGGQAWTPLTDNQPSLAIGALTLDPKNPDIIYAGTGEPTPGLDNYYGAGLLKSTDGGQSWNLLGENVFAGMGIAKIVIDPTNSNVLYAASASTGKEGAVAPPRGVFKSSDGGQTWQAQVTCSDCQGASDLLINPTTPNTLYAGFYDYGVARTTDGGANWQVLKNGLPNPDQYRVQRIILDMSRSNPEVIYASFHLQIPNQYDGAIVFKTTDGGQSWAEVSTGNFNFCGSQCWYSHIIAVHPTNPNTLLLGGMADYVGDTPQDFRIQRVVVRTDDSGATYRDLTPNTAPDRTLHPDMHALAFDPNNPQVIWAGNDGGIFKSSDGGATWQGRNSTLATLQFTGFAVDQNNASIIQGGMQDNNKAFTLDGGATLAWTAADVGDGGFALIDPFNSNIWYGTRFGRSFQRTDEGPNTPGYWPYKVEGVNQQDPSLFYMPIAADSSTQGVFYLGTYRVYRTTNRGESWTPISDALGGQRGYVSAIAVAPSDPQTVYAGTADGNVQVTRNTGGAWSNVTATNLPGRFVSRIVVAANDPQTAYIVFNGFSSHTPGQPGHIFKTTNAGGAWQDISGNLPDTPLLSLIVDRRHPGTLYVGSDTGVFQSVDDGRNWIPFNNGMPNVAVVDLAMNRSGTILYAATHGRSIFRAILELEPQNNRLFLPLLQKGEGGASGPTATPTSTPTSAPTNTPTSTPTPVTPEGTAFPTLTPSPTGTPTATPQPTRTPVTGATPTPTGTPNVRNFGDDFGNPNSGWAKTSVSNCSFDYSDLNNNGQSDVYSIAAGVFDNVCVASSPAQAQAEGVYQVYAAKNSLADGSVYGLVFGLDNPTISSNSRFYVFWVDPSDQTYALRKYDQGTWTYLTNDSGNPFIFSTAIAPGDSANLLKVRRQGGAILLFVNNRYLTLINDNSLAGNGYIGLANWFGYDVAASVAHFDDFVINRFDLVYQDAFAQDDSGWYVDASDICQAAYANGLYRTATQPAYLCLYRSPAAGQPNGRFEVQVRRSDSFYQTAYGLMVGEDGNFTSYYVLLVIPDIQAFALLKYIDGQGWFGVSWDPIEQTAWFFSDAVNSGTGVNKLVLERDGDLFAVWINDQFVGSYLDDTPLAGGYYGVINWSSEFETAIADFDDYKVTAWDAGGGLQIHAASVQTVTAALTAPGAIQPLPTATR